MDHRQAVVPENPGPKRFLNNKPKGEVLSATSGSAQRRKLADISNLQEPAKQPNQGVKQQRQSTLLSSKEYIEKLEKENMTLMKVLMDRNKIIELSGIELQKLRISLQKAQEQNLQLAQANSKMLADLNADKDRLKALQHELGCKNGLLKARKLQLEEQTNPRVFQTSENEVGKIDHGEAGDSIQADDGDSITCNIRGMRQSIVKSSGNSIAKSAPANENANKKRRVCGRKNSSKSEEANSPGISNEANQAKENVDNKRQCVRRQSARLKSQEPEPTENLQEIDDAVGTTKNQRISLRKQSTRLKSQAPEPTENLQEIHDVKETNKNRMTSVRRQSTRFKSREPEPAQNLHDIDDTKEKTMYKRTSVRGPSTRFKSQEFERSETMLETHDAKETTKNQGPSMKGQSTSLNSQACVVANNNADDPRLPNLPLGDNTVPESDPPRSDFLKNHQEEKRSSFKTNEPEGISRTSVGRPLRQAAEKIQSYREISLKVKMRRSE